MEAADRLKQVKEYYFSTKLKEVRELIAGGKPVINMGIGSPDLDPAPEVLETLIEAVREDRAHQYQSYQGIPELRQGVRDFYGSHFGVDLDENGEILPLMGSKEGIMHISLAFLNPGDEVLIPDPGYPTYTSVTNIVGALPRYYDLEQENGWLPDLEALRKSDLSKVKMMWLNYPHMPTGATATAELFEELIALAKEHDILLVNDNPYSFVLNDKPLSILAFEGAREVALELNSLSKTFNMAGWRVGFVLGSKEHISDVLKIKSNMDSGMFYGIQKGAAKALELSDHWYESINEVYARRRDLIFQIADTLKCTYDQDSTGMFVWAKLPEGSVPAEQYIDHILYTHSVFITPGTVFGKNGEGYIRFSLCVDEGKIREVLSRLTKKEVGV